MANPHYALRASGSFSPQRGYRGGSRPCAPYVAESDLGTNRATSFTDRCSCLCRDAFDRLGSINVFNCAQTTVVIETKLRAVVVSRCVMQQSQQTPSIFLIGRPRCEKCNTRMALTRIEPNGPGHDRRTFECPACEHYEVLVVPFVHCATPHT